MWNRLITAHRGWALSLLALLAAIGGVTVVWRSRVDATPPVLRPLTPPGQPNANTADASVPPVAATPVSPVPPVARQPALSTATPAVPEGPARIMFSTIPPTNASVTWGKKLLGRIGPKQPLVILRPRDSGPLDVTVSAPGYLPVQTRAHTFADTHIQVKLTTPDQKPTLFGYRAPLDAGVPVDPTAATPDPTAPLPPEVP
jgi:hypothetical protein